jgi:purine catabolism regulator
MNVADVLKLSTFRNARLVAGAAGLEREVRWVHVVDIPDPASWVRPGHLLLTTGYAWPREEGTQRMLMQGFAAQGLAGVALAVPQFFDHFPEVARTEADDDGLPLIELPWEVPFTSITEEVHRAILAEHYQVIEQSEAIHRALTKAAIEATSLQDIADVLGKLIMRAVTIEDVEGRVLATHSITVMEDHVRRESLARGQTPAEFLQHLERLGHLDSLHRSSEPVRIPPLDDLGARGRVVCPIRLKGELVGFVWIIEGDQPLSDLDLRAAENTAVVSALHIAHQRELASLEARLHHTLLDSLLSGQVTLTPQTLERAALMGFDPDSRYRVGIIVLDEPLPLEREGFLRRERLAGRLRLCLEETGVHPLISFSSNQVRFLLPDTVRPEWLWERLRGPSVALLLGRPYQEMEGITRSYAEASALVPHMRLGRLATYDSMLLPRVMAGETEAQDAFLELLFGPLRRVRGGGVLIQTLLTLAECGFHQKRTATVLNLHINTLRYRLRRATDITRLDFDDAETRFRLQLARHLLSLNHKEGASIS